MLEDILENNKKKITELEARVAELERYIIKLIKEIENDRRERHGNVHDGVWNP